MPDVADNSMNLKLTMTSNVETTGDLDRAVSLDWSELKRNGEKEIKASHGQISEEFEYKGGGEID